MKKSLCLFLLLLLAGCAGSRPPDLRAGLDGVCFLNLWHKASNETLRVQFCDGAGYDRNALRQLNYFFRDRKTNEIAEIDPALFDFITGLRTRLALPVETRIEISSAYRSRATNEALREKNKGAAKESLHIQGRAVDLRIPGLAGKTVAAVAKTMHRGGVSWYVESDHVHIDTGEVRSWRGR